MPKCSSRSPLDHSLIVYPGVGRAVKSQGSARESLYPYGGEWGGTGCNTRSKTTSSGEPLLRGPRRLYQREKVESWQMRTSATGVPFKPPGVDIGMLAKGGLERWPI